VRSVQHRDDGFSLVEILVALFIMALASAMVVMAMPSRPDQLNAEVGQFEAVLARTMEQAISRGQARGIRVQDNSYSVYTRVAGRWVPARGEAEALAGGVTLNLITKDRESDDSRPQIVADASGIVSGPDVRFSKGGRTLDVELTGRAGDRD
jgi:type II secretion system protein H